MEKDSGSSFHQHHLHLPSPESNLLLCPFDMGQRNNEPFPCFVDDSRTRNVPLFPVPRLQHLRASEPYNSSNWFHSCQAFTPVLNTEFKENFLGGPMDLRQQGIPTTGTAPSQKKFIVFDKSGERTTLMYTSRVEAVVQYGNCWVPKPPIASSLGKGLNDSTHYLRPIMNYEFSKENSREATNDEMHENTEELDALLCSDSDSYLEDDEEMSTGHSPSTMTDDAHRDLILEIGEEIDSFPGPPSKRQKLSGGSYDPLSCRCTGSFLRECESSSLEDDAESSYGNNNTPNMSNLGSPSSGGKRSRKDIISEKLSILQSIIPNLNGKDASIIIDEAIHYLKLLKVEAKALGIDTL